MNIKEFVVGFIKKWLIKIILIISIPILIILIVSASLLNLDVTNGLISGSGSSLVKSDGTYSEYSPMAYYNGIYVTENGTLMSEVKVKDMWNNDDRYRTYLSNSKALAYFLNAQVVSQYPYIYSDKATATDLNGTIKFYRDNASDFMKYVSEEQLNSYIDEYNTTGSKDAFNKAISSFTLNDDGTIKIAYAYSISNEMTTNDQDAAQDYANDQSSQVTNSIFNDNYYVSSGYNVLYTTNIAYKSLVQNYAVQFELLWAIITAGHDGSTTAGNAEDFAHAIASMAYDGEIALMIDDNASTVTTTTEKTYNTRQRLVYQDIVYNYVEQQPSNSGEISDVEKSATANVVYIDSNNAYTTKTVTVENTNSPTLKVRKIESWCAKYDIGNPEMKENTTSTNEESTDTTGNSDMTGYNEIKRSKVSWDSLGSCPEKVQESVKDSMRDNNIIDITPNKVNATEILYDKDVDINTNTKTETVTNSIANSTSTTPNTDTSAWKQVANGNGTTTTYVGDGSAMEGGAYNALGGKLEEGMCAIDPRTFSYKDVIYIETQASGEGSYANGKYFWACDTGGAIKGNHIDVYAPVSASRANSAPYGTYKKSNYYVVESGVSWEDFKTKYAGLSGGGSTITTSYSNETAISPAFNTDLVDLFNVSSFSSIKKYLTKDVYKYFMEIIEANQTTANMTDLINYIFNQVTGTEDYGKNLEWSSVWSSLYSNMNSVDSSSLLDTAREYIHSWEGCTAISGDKYKIESDGYGNPTVGWGVDINSHRQAFINAGYTNLSIGNYVDISFVDSVEKDEIKKWYEQAKKSLNGINLKAYQWVAIISRTYNSGTLGYKHFAEKYRAYWSEDKDNQYYGKTDISDNILQEEGLYKNYMRTPNTAKKNGVSVYSPGLQNRRNDEWHLFATGYAPRSKMTIPATIEENTTNGSTDEGNLSGAVKTIINTAKSKIGCKYVSGAKGPNAFDCSGLVYWCYLQAGITVPYSSGGYPQYSAYKVSLDQLQPGDVLWKNGHVAIYIGDDKFIGAQNSNVGVVERSLSANQRVSGEAFVCGYRMWK